MKLTEVSSKLQKCLAAMHMLSGWIDYQEAKDECCASGLEDFIHKIEEAGLHSEVERSFLKGFYHMWLGAVCDKSASVRRFRRNISASTKRKSMLQKFTEDSVPSNRRLFLF